MGGFVRCRLNVLFGGDAVKKGKLPLVLLAVIVTIIVPRVGIWTASRAMAQTHITPYYQGKTLRLISGHSPGGSADLWARLLARHVARFIPGSPTVIVENRPGKAATNKWVLEKAPNDGFVIAAIGGGPANVMVETRAFDLFKGIMIAGVETNRIMAGRRSVLPKGIHSLRNPTKKPIFVSTTGATDWPEPTSLELLGLTEGTDFKWVYGFGGTGPAHAAIERGEIDLNMYSDAAALRYVIPEPEKLVGIFQFGKARREGGKLTFVRDDTFSEIPTLEEAYVSLYGKKPGGIRWLALTADMMALASNRNVYAPPGTPGYVVEILTSAWETMVKDPKFLADQKKMLGTDAVIHHVGREETEARLREIVRLFTDPEVESFIASKIKK